MDNKVPGKNAAIASLVLGIIAVVFWFFGGWTAFLPLVSVVLGIIGLVLAGHAKKQGYTESIRTAGFVLSLLGVIVGAIVFVSCLACFGGALLGATTVASTGSEVAAIAASALTVM